jgi:hypothetical protein
MTDQDIEELRRLLDAGHSLEESANAMNRPRTTVQQAARTNGLVSRVKPKLWSASDDQLLRECVAAGMKYSLIAKTLERTEKAVGTRCTVIGIKAKSLPLPKQIDAHPVRVRRRSGFFGVWAQAVFGDCALGWAS